MKCGVVYSRTSDNTHTPFLRHTTLVFYYNIHYIHTTLCVVHVHMTLCVHHTTSYNLKKIYTLYFCATCYSRRVVLQVVPILQTRHFFDFHSLPIIKGGLSHWIHSTIAHYRSVSQTSIFNGLVL